MWSNRSTNLVPLPVRDGSGPPCAPTLQQIALRLARARPHSCSRHPGLQSARSRAGTRQVSGRGAPVSSTPSNHSFGSSGTRAARPPGCSTRTSKTLDARGSYGTLRRYLRPCRKVPGPRPQAAVPASRRRVDPQPLRHPRRTPAPPVQDRLGRMPRTDRPHRARPNLRDDARPTPRTQLPGWIAAVHGADLLSLRRSVSHLEGDLDVVVVGLTLRWSSGVVEGHVNRIKMLERQMFGRAGLPLRRP